MENVLFRIKEYHQKHPKDVSIHSLLNVTIQKLNGHSGPLIMGTHNNRCRACGENVDLQIMREEACRTSMLLSIQREEELQAVLDECWDNGPSDEHVDKAMKLSE
jgi:hypothetical protein